MSQAFVRESDDQWLSDVGPSLSALLFFLTRDNNGVRVIEQSNYFEPAGKQVYKMSNGASYAKNIKGQWEIFESQ